VSRIAATWACDGDLLLVTPLALWGYHLAEAAGCPLMVLSPILAASYQPADDLHEFLDSGDRPFYAGFGSMIAPDPAALGSLLVEAARLANQRLILSPGWGRIVPRTALPASVYVLEECP
jgi:UDP:flavonoid glycosyltransferase YjiC (YdhE family)